MALSQDVKTQFAKVAIGKKKTKSEETINGTYKTINGKEYVQLDGSDILTPVTSTVTAETGDRVKVLIKEHTATITGNITSPSARSKDLNTIKDEVDEFGNTIKQMDNSIQQQGNSIVQINNSINQHDVILNQHDTAINQQGDTIVSINNTITQQGNTILEMNNQVISMGNQVESMNNTVESQNNKITEMNNTVISLNNTITQYDNIIEQQGNKITQFGDVINSQQNQITMIDNTVKAQGNNIITMGSDILILNSGFQIVDGKLTGLSEAVIGALRTDVLDTEYAQINFANIEMAAVEKLFADSGIIQNLVTKDGHITGELVGVTLKGDLIEGNTIVADKIILKGENGLYYKLNTEGETLEVAQTSENSLNGQIIAAHSITASKIAVTDLVAFGATIGGFDISDKSINTHLKDNVNSASDGIYLGSDGQMALGNDLNHIKYYKDETGKYNLDVRLDKLYLGSSKQTADKQMEAMVEVSADNLTAVFRTSGGSNLLRNSVGYSNTDFWNTSGSVTTKQDDDMSLSGSEFILKNDAYIEQVYNTQIGNLYSVAFLYKHTIVGTAGTVKVELIGDGTTKVLLNTTDSKTEWTKFVLSEPYEARANNPKIKISVTGDDTFEITDLIISPGTNDVWSGAIGELYGKQNQLDSNGLRLYSESSNKSTNTTSTSYQLKDGSNVVAELTKDRVYSDFGEFNNGMKIGRLRTVVLDNNNIIEYI